MAATLAGPGLAAKLTDFEHTRIEEPRPAGVPSDAELEASHAVIGEIEINVRDIFDESDRRENSGLYRLADRLHVTTRPAEIRAQLLFKSGEPYLARKLAETERNLRLLTYLYDARVVPVRFKDGKVDVKVTTKDVWTLSPGLSFGRTGGTNNSNAYLLDSNILGTGKSLQFGHTVNVDRISDGVSWSDPTVLGIEVDQHARVHRFERRLSAHAAGRASVLFARYPRRGQHPRVRLRSHGVAL